MGVWLGVVVGMGGCRGRGGCRDGWMDGCRGG